MKCFHLFLILFAALALGFGGCSSEDDSTTTAGPLEGSWQKDIACVSEGASSSDYYNSTITFGATAFTNRRDTYDVSPCTTLQQTNDYIGTYTSTSTTGTITFTSSTMTAKTAEYVTSLNANGGYCGLTWVIDEAQDVTNCPNTPDLGVQTFTYSISGTTLTIIDDSGPETFTKL